jgi:hypothetical protein
LLARHSRFKPETFAPLHRVIVPHVEHQMLPLLSLTHAESALRAGFAGKSDRESQTIPKGRLKCWIASLLIRTLDLVGWRFFSLSLFFRAWRSHRLLSLPAVLQEQ